jgi:hypothetical protein
MLVKTAHVYAFEDWGDGPLHKILAERLGQAESEARIIFPLILSISAKRIIGEWL